MLVQGGRDGNMNDDLSGEAERAAILRRAIELLEEVLLDTEGERRAAILKLITKAGIELARLDKRQLH